MKPGATTCPVASIVRAASPRSPGPMATMRSPSIATSAERAPAPVPSITDPPQRRSDQAIGSGLEDLDRLHAVALLDPVHVLHAARHLTEYGVVAVEVRGRAVTDVELAARRVRMLAPRHGHGAAQVLLRVELGGDRVAGTAGPVAFGATALHDEVGHHAVERQPVVVPLLRKRDEVLHRLRRVLRIEC